ncbi:MAG: hypothetical protein P8N49_05285 [Opitutales bacterium]|nr:hypothetical protein [Opitutales bacterium]
MTDKILAFTGKLKANPTNRFHRYNLAQAYFEEDDFLHAEKLFSECFAMADDWMMAALGLGKCYLALERVDDARVILTKTVDLARKQGHDDPLEEAESLLENCSST